MEKLLIYIYQYFVLIKSTDFIENNIIVLFTKDIRKNKTRLLIQLIHDSSSKKNSYKRTL